MAFKNHIFLLIGGVFTGSGFLLSPHLGGAGGGLHAQPWNIVTENISGDVRTFYVDTVENALYVGGNFAYMEGIKVNGIAKYYNYNWYAMGNGTYCNPSCNPVFGIISYKNKIYCEGVFTENYSDYYYDWIGEWNDTSWTQTTKVKGTIFNLKVINNELYAMGAFDSIGGIKAMSIAKWDGTQWYDLGFGTYAPIISGNLPFVFDAVWYKGWLYVGGNFGDINSGGYTTDIARFNGTTWERVANGLRGSFCDVSRLIVYKDTLYVGGQFFTYDGNPENHIVRWDGNQWLGMGGGLGGLQWPMIEDMVIYKNELFISGRFNTAGTITARSIAKWDGTKWCHIPNVNETATAYYLNTEALAVLNDTLYAGGAYNLNQVDSPRNYIARLLDATPDTCVVVSGIQSQIPSPQSEILISPNPFSTTATLIIATQSGAKGKQSMDNLELKIYDVLGQVVHQSAIINEQSIIVNLQDLPSGIYLYQLTGEQKKISRGKLVKQ